MSAFDTITRKKLGLELSADEISTLIFDYMAGNITDAQMAAFLMAVCLKGMTSLEAAALTSAMTASGETIDTSALPELLDKHSTGGIGDKTTFLVGAMLAARGYHVAMMSGRGLGHTGGTIDKMESVDGWHAIDTPERYLKVASSSGFAMMEQTNVVASADKRLYALRNETSTIDSPALIAASIMSKKMASGTRNIVLDVKWGPGAFMKQEGAARELADMMAGIAGQSGISTAVALTPMENVLGSAVGNAVEVAECWEMMTNADALAAPFRQDLRELSVMLATKAASLVDKRDEAELATELDATLSDGSAARAFSAFVEAHGGKVAEDGTPVFTSEGKPGTYEIKSQMTGIVGDIDLEALGLAIAALGANKFSPDDEIRHDVGLRAYKKKLDRVEKGEVIAALEWRGERPSHRSGKTLKEAAADIRSCFFIA